jgi:hypothetical protein
MMPVVNRYAISCFDNNQQSIRSFPAFKGKYPYFRVRNSLMPRLKLS